MKPVWKWIIGVVAFLILAVAIGAWYLSRHWKPILDTQLKAAIVNSSDSLYRITYDDISLNLVTGHAALINFELIPDSAVYERLKTREEAPDNIYNIKVDRLRIRNFHPVRIVRGKKLKINDIIFDNPYVHITNEYHTYNDTVKTEESKSLYESISNTLREVRVDNIVFNNIQFKFSKKQDTTVHTTELANINLNIKDILIDSLSQTDTSRFFHTRSIDLEMPGTRFHTPDSLYYVSFDHLNVSTAGNRLLLTGLTYAPRVSRTEFYRTVKLAKDMFVIKLNSLLMEDIDLQQFVRNQRIYAGSLYLDSGKIEISNDLRYPKKPTDKIGKSPHQQLMKLNQNIKIDSVMIKGLDISYAEIGEKQQKEGKITFERSVGKLYNVTNDSLALLQNKTMVWDMTTYMMNSGKISVVFTFDMLSKNGAHTYKGVLGPMNGRSLNRILTPLLNVEVASANIKGVSFDVSADDYRSRGSLLFDYNNLKAKILTTDSEGEKSSLKVVSFLANSFIINDSNPDANGVYHRGRIDYTRPHTHSFFKTLWQSLLDGIKPTVGISKEREAKLTNTAEGVQGAVEKTGGFLRNIFRKRDEKEDKKNE